MKNMLFMAAFALAALASCKKASVNDDNGGNAQIIPASAVPAAVTAALSSQFTGASEIEWRRGSDDFSAQFNHNSSRNDASFDDRGNRRSHSVISLDAVPSAVLAAFRQQFANDVVYEWKLRNDGTWKAHFMRGTVKWEATFSATGSLIKVEHY
jgi:hypothetical protein